MDWLTTHHSERERRIHEALSELDVTTGQGKVGNHFSKGNLGDSDA